LLLGRSPTLPLTHGDGAVLGMPYLQSALRAGSDWTDHLYRFSTIGGSKMHEFGGTMPIVQLCAVFSPSVTTAANLITIFIQICVGFFSLKAVAALKIRWGSSGQISTTERITTISLACFAPFVGWRIANGHENLLLGLFPLLTCITLIWVARARTLTITCFALGTFAVANGVSGLGTQSVIYSLVFAMPFGILVLLDAPRGERWRAREWIAIAGPLAGVLCVLPRVSVMVAHATGPDATRALSAPVTYSFGEGRWIDWITSIPWTSWFAHRLGGIDSIHEHNYPLGPLACFMIVLWPRGKSRRMLWGLVVGAVVAILFADNIAPISSVLLRVVPPLQAFRVPARAMLSVLLFVPIFGMATLAAWPGGRTERARWRWLGLVLGALVLAFGAPIPALVREGIAWLACSALVGVARRAPARVPRWPLPILAALGALSFSAHFPAGQVEPIESVPEHLRGTVLARIPDLKTSLDRIELVDPAPPYALSTAWAARLPSLDGVWYPPRRFLDLLSALDGKPLPSTTCAFQLGTSSRFDVLQQLYNVRYVIVPKADHSSLVRAPDSRAAWFPTAIQMIDAPGQMTAGLGTGDNMRARIRSTGWVLSQEHATVALPSGCADARVLDINTDARGQTASFDVQTPTDCILIVATNYVSTFTAQAHDGNTVKPLQIFPIDIALTAISVPAGSSTITLEPVVEVPRWAFSGMILGIVVLVLGLLGVIHLSREV
jgi:hypothetical protein